MRKILITLGLCLFTTLLYGQEIIREPVKVVEKTLAEKIDARLKIELVDVAETDTILIQEKIAKIVNEELGKNLVEFRVKITPPPIEVVKINIPEIEVLKVKYIDFWKDIPKFETPTIYVMAIKYLQFVWRDNVVGGFASLTDKGVVVVPITERQLKVEIK